MDDVIKYFKYVKYFKILNVALVFTLTACSSDHKISTKHQSGAPKIFEEVEPQFSYSTATAAGLDSIRSGLSEMRRKNRLLKAEAESKDLFGKDSSLVQQIFDEVYTPLKEIVLNSNYMYDPLYSTEPDFKRKFREINKAIDLMQKLNPEFVKQKLVLSRYWDSLAARCANNLQGCEYAKKLGKSDGARTTRLLEAYGWSLHETVLALQKSNLKINSNSSSEIPEEMKHAHDRLHEVIVKKKNVIHFALGMRTGSRHEDSTLSLLYLVSTNELIELPNRFWSTSDREQHERNAERVTRELHDRLDNENYRTKIKPYFDEKTVWTRFTLRNPIEQRMSMGSIRTAIEVMKISCRFFRDEESGFDKAVQSSLNEKDAWGRDGFVKTVNDLRASEKAGLTLANMRLLEPFEATEELFYLDQLYRGHWNRGIMQECWEASLEGKSRAAIEARNKAMMLLIERYIKVEFLRRTIATNEFIRGIFESDDGSNTSIERDRLFLQAIEESRLLKSDWDRMIRSFEEIRGFVKTNMQSLGNEDGEQSVEFERLDRIFTSIKTNIKLVSVYPNMLLLAYYLAAREFEVEITTFWGYKFKLIAKTIINWLFGGTTGEPARPWFNFGNDSRRIKRFENLYAFFYALKTNTFENFSKVDVNKFELNVVGFFNQVIKRYISSDVVTISENLKAIERKFNDSPKYNDSISVCHKELAAHEKAENGRAFVRARETADYQIDLTLDAFMKRTYMGLNSHDFGGMIGEVYTGDLEETLSEIHNEFYPKVLFVRTMIEILEDHWAMNQKLKSHSTLPSGALKRIEDYETIQKKLDQVKSNFDVYYDSVRRSYQLARNRSAEADDCIDIIHKIEFEQQRSLYDLESEFLGNVYDALNQLVEIMEDKERIAAMGLRKGDVLEIFNIALNGQYGTEDRAKLNLPILTQLSEQSKVYKAEVGDVPGFDEFNESGSFIYSRFNYVLRARNNLQQVVNRRIKVSLPSAFEISAFYEKAKDEKFRVKVSLGSGADRSKEEFIRKAMTAAENFEFVGWWDRRTALFYHYRRELKQDLYQVEQLGIVENAKENCNRASVREAGRFSCTEWKDHDPIKMHQITDEIFYIVDFLDITPEDEGLLMRLGKSTKIIESQVNALFLDEQNVPRSLFEQFYKTYSTGKALNLYHQAAKAASTFNSMFKDRNSEDTQDLTIVDWKNQEARELLFLAKHDTVRSNTREVYRPSVLVAERAVREFEETVKCYELADQSLSVDDLKVLYKLEVDDRGRVNRLYMYPKESMTSPTVYLDSKDIDNWLAKRSSFIQDTKGVFLPKEGDEGFVAGKDYTEFAQISVTAGDCKKILGQVE